MKRCGKCKEEKEVTEFSKDSKLKDGLDNDTSSKLLGDILKGIL